MTFITVLETILPYISGLWTLFWVLIGFVVTLLLAELYGRDRINKAMKRIGLILLFVFIPLLLFRIFLNITFGRDEVIFAGLTFGVLFFMYVLAFVLGRLEANRLDLEGMERRTFIKTVLTNQGRSAAFVGGAILAIEQWRVPAAIYIALVGIGLFAVIPYVLSVMHGKETNSISKEVSPLPWFLKLYPWYLLSFVIAGIMIHRSTGITTNDLGDWGTVLFFITAITIPAGLYYVGSGIHFEDLKVEEMKKMFLRPGKGEVRELHWTSGRNAFLTTMLYTPVITLLIFTPLLLLDLIPSPWFVVIILNSIMPITSTNMFLIPYGLNTKGTALAVTWTTIIAVPILMGLIILFENMGL